jgi:hypothetical protein
VAIERPAPSIGERFKFKGAAYLGVRLLPSGRRAAPAANPGACDFTLRREGLRPMHNIAAMPAAGESFYPPFRRARADELAVRPAADGSLIRRRTDRTADAADRRTRR